MKIKVHKYVNFEFVLGVRQLEGRWVCMIRNNANTTQRFYHKLQIKGNEEGWDNPKDAQKMLDDYVKKSSYWSHDKTLKKEVRIIEWSRKDSKRPGVSEPDDSQDTGAEVKTDEVGEEHLPELLPKVRKRAPAKPRKQGRNKG